MRVLLIISILIVSYHVNQRDLLIKDKQGLISYAEPILFKTYGKEEIISEKPYIISFKNGIWIMDGTLPSPFTIGGTFHIEIKAKDGKVVKLVHYK